MIRIVYDAELEINQPHRCAALVNALSNGGFKPDVVLHNGANTGKVTMLLRQTDMQAYDFLTIHMSKAKNYAICTGCNSIHFKTEDTCKEMFRCPCGSYVNKPIKQK